MIASIVIFFIIFGVLGIRVNECFVGMGPTIKKKKKGDTLYSIKLLPIGGACVFDGMDPVEEEKEGYDEHSFLRAPVWRRIATLFGGPFANFIIAYILAVVLVNLSPWDMPTIKALTEDSAAQEAGMEAGDTIISIDGEKVYMSSEIMLISQFAEGSPMDIVYERNGEVKKTVLTPKFSEENKRYYMGVYLGEYKDVKGPESLKYAWYTVRYNFIATYRSLALLVQGKLSKDDVSGSYADCDFSVSHRLVGQGTEGVQQLAKTIRSDVDDGGRLVFQFIEVIFGKPVPPEKEGVVHMVGMILLIALMVFVLVNDITKFTR